MGRKYNLKMLFDHNGNVRQIEKGDFGDVDENLDKKKIHTVAKTDSLIAWPVNPDFTGPHMILEMLNLTEAGGMAIQGFSF